MFSGQGGAVYAEMAPERACEVGGDWLEDGIVASSGSFSTHRWHSAEWQQRLHCSGFGLSVVAGLLTLTSTKRTSGPTS